MRRIIFTAGILICLLAFMPCVYAYDDSTRTILFVGEPEDGFTYDVGDRVPVEVRFFDSAAPKDADTTPTVTINEYETNSKDVHLSRKGVGVYSGEFTIAEGDVEDSNYLLISAEATLGKDNPEDDSYDYDSDYGALLVAGETGFDVVLDFDKTGSYFISAEPGDTVQMTITVTDGGNNVDPESLELTANEKELTYTRKGTGLYEASYIVSPTVRESERIDVEVDAEYYGEYASDDGAIIVDMMALWYHELGITSSYAQFELCVADMEGSSLSGALIDFSYEIDDYGVDDDSPSQTGLTDSEGRATFTISHSSASMIYIEGTIGYSGKTQHFDGDIQLSSEGTGFPLEEPSEWNDFEVIYQENAGPLNPGETVTLNYIAYAYAIPVSNQPIIYYLHTYWDFITSGSTTCDSSGRFSITFTVPDSTDTIYGEFESPFEKEHIYEHCDCDNGRVYRESYDYIYQSDMNIFTDKDTSLSIVTDSFEIGTRSMVTATRPNSQGFMAFAMVLVGEIKIEDIEPDYRLEWEAWVGLSFSFVYPVSVENNRIIQDVLVPEFLPEDETYTILVIFIDSNSLTIDFHWNYIHVRPTASQESEEEWDLQDVIFSNPVRLFGVGVPCLLILFVIIIILVALVAAMRPRKEETRIPTGDVVTVEPEPVVVKPRAPGPPYGPRNITQRRAYMGGYYGPPGGSTSSRVGPRPSQYTRRYQVSPVTQRDQNRPRIRSQPPTTYQSTRAIARQRYEPLEKRLQKPKTVAIRCQGCRNEFYIQDKTPPFKTKCPFCAKHNIVV